jgi:hypothetical protein
MWRREGFDRNGLQHDFDRSGCRYVLGRDHARSRVPAFDRGVILMVVGVIGLGTFTIVFTLSRRPAGGRRRTYDRQATDAQGLSTSLHEEAH